jgi:uncharacterized heparinase superfamily protein
VPAFQVVEALDVVERIRSGFVARPVRFAAGISAPGKAGAIQPVERDTQDKGLRASHDGYADLFNVIHQRTLLLAVDGTRLDGEDVFMPAKGETVPAGRDQFAVRFHLHPTVRATRPADGHSAMLLMRNKEVWSFSAYEDRVDIEESVFLAANDGPRRTVQIVLYGRARKVMREQWTFALSHGAPGAGLRRGRGDEPQLPL